tara:strand:+ start:418 stop:2274 length:1857 start_codon:yes stop_codon:yes gene_type:complete
MQNLQNELIELLKMQDNLVIDGQLNKNKIIELGLKVEPQLIGLLIKNATFKKHFFTELGSVLVFDKIKFQRFVNNKSFLPDSYTAFKNKIGLAINDDTTDNFIKAKNDVVLAWPHKDCVLEGGQTKEDQKRNEIFWNETLAPDNVDRLLDAKAFTNFKKYDKDGEHNVTELKGNENLILKGNNLLVLSSLLKTHRGKIKLIYIDPPYNTGSDGFNYNDSFNHSTWLTFMKNRLVIAKELLKDDGVLYASVDDKEIHYLKVLLDEVFERENFVGNIAWESKTKSQNTKTSYNKLQPKVEHILLYTKKDCRRFNLISKGKIDYPLKDDKGFYREYILEEMDAEGVRGRSTMVFNIKGILPTEGKQWKLGKDSITEYDTRGDLFIRESKVIIKKRDSDERSEKTEPFWGFLPKDIGTAETGKKELNKILSPFNPGFDTVKPIELLKRLIFHSTNENDIILDCFAGSGTTGNAVLKLCSEDKIKRNFIMIEQMDYINTLTCQRINNIIRDKYTEDSYVYAELLEYNQKYISQIQESKTKEDVLKVWKEMEDKAFLSFQFNKDIFNERLEAFKTTSLETMQQYLIEILDKNQLYVNFSEIEDETFAVSKEDKALNYSFYKANN